MKILFCCEFYAPSVGGVQEVMKQLAERLVARGHAVTVATTALPERRFPELNGVRIQEFAVSGNLAHGMKGDLERYRRFVAEQDFDVVMIKAAQQWTFDALWPVLDRIRGGKIFIPCGFSSLYEPQYAAYFEQLPAVLGRIDHLIFYSTDYRDIRFVKDCGLTNFSILTNGASETEFGVRRRSAFRKRCGLSEEDLLFLTVGSPARMKGHYEIADAFLRADFSGRAATLVLNGGASPAQSERTVSKTVGVKIQEYWDVVRDVERQEGAVSAVTYMGHGILNKLGVRAGRYVRQAGTVHDSQRNELQCTINEIHGQKNGKRVLVANLPRRELVEAYMDADLFVFASYVEYSPLVLFEAAAAGTPFLSVPVGNAVEIADWTGAGVICPAPQDERGYTKVDPQLFAEQWTSLVRDRARLRRMGEIGKENWAARFTWDKITDQYEALFQKVAACV